MQALLTPLHWWSDANRIAAAVHVEVGKLYAVAIGGSQPTRAMVAAVRAQLRELEEALKRGVRMEGGSVQVDEARSEVPEIAPVAPAPEQPAPPPAPATEVTNLRNLIIESPAAPPAHPRVSELVRWMRERESIRRLKEAGAPRPWTDDVILDEWRFCNVNRCDDTVTRWIFEHVIAAHASSPSLWFNLVIARLVNWPDTLGALGYVDSWDAERFVATLGGLRGKVWTGAYMIPAGPPGVEKARYLADSTLSPLWAARHRAPASGTCAAWAEFIGRARSMGDFLVNQVVTDMKYTPVLAAAPDRETFVLAGPGTKRGLNRLLGRELEATWAQAQAARTLATLREQVIVASPELSEVLRDLNNLSNCMCEFDKYERVRLAEGKPRSRYVPAADGDALDLFASRAG
jgi:hypothetical protein